MARPEAVDAARDAGRRCSWSRSRRTTSTAALDRVAPEALDGAVILPLLNGLEHVEAIRARVGARCDGVTRVALRRGRVDRPACRPSSPEPGVVVQATRHGTRRSHAASRELEPTALADRARAAPRSRDRASSSATTSGAVLWEKAARLAVLAAATVATGARSRPAPATIRHGARASRRRSPRRARWQPPTVSSSTRPPNGRSSRRMPDDLTTSAARDAASGRRDRARRDRRLRRPRRREARRPDARARRAPRGGGVPSAIALIGARARLGARAREERPPARGPPAARLRDRDRAAVGGLRPHRRLDRQRADRAGRAVVRRRRPVPPAGRVLDVDVPGHRVDRVDAAAARGALRPVRDRARDEPLPGAGRRSGAGSTSCSRRPRRTRSARSSGSSSIRGRCGSSTRSTA